MTSDFNYNFGFLVEEIFEHGYTIKSRCFEGLYKTWTPPPPQIWICTPLWTPIFFNDSKVSRLVRAVGISPCGQRLFYRFFELIGDGIFE